MVIYSYIRKNSYFVKNGYTIIELLVALFIFGIVITSAVGIVVSSIQASRDSADIQNIEDNSRAIFESMTREMRTGSDYKDVANGKRFCFQAAGTSSSVASFVRYHLNNGVMYRRSISDGNDNDYRNCSNTNDGITLPMNSDDVIVEELDFAVNTSDSHLMVTISIKMTSANNVNLAPVYLQTTVSSRNYQ